MASEDNLLAEQKFLRARAPQNIPYDLLPHDPAQTPASLSGLPEGLGDFANLSPQAMQVLLKAIRRQGNFLTIPFVGDTTTVQLRPVESRTYFLLQNIAGAGNLILGLGFKPTATNGLILTPGSSYEPFTVPTNDVYITASQAGVTGILWYASEGQL